MSSARCAAGHPGFIPRRRAITLLTPSAAITIGARSSRPSRVRQRHALGVLSRLGDRGRRQHARAGLDRQLHEQVIELDAADQDDRRPVRSACGTHRPTALRDRGSRPGACGIAASASGSHGKRDEHARADAAAARFLPRQREAFDDQHAHACARQTQRRGGARGTRAGDDDVGVVVRLMLDSTGCPRPRWSLLLRI